MTQSAKLLLACLLFVLIFTVGNVMAQTKPRIMDENEPTISKFMRAKLQHSQKLIEALALEDYGTMAKSAQEMSLLTRAEQWQLLQTPDYLFESDAFRRSADEMMAAAKEKDLDRAALAYVDMTMKCVKCHKYVRHTKMAAIPNPGKASITLESLVQPVVRVRDVPDEARTTR
ncbi:hypothetical protein ETAA8_56190 [Anatilimnocola aggregata]|uniref:Secreted protein n=1 Tax=Anatilimnocola aggregata TaxID=2528021 RepID=A0A517YJT1_9BACT|nr:hypothetical protein [Anatilimnocola aggregata]QDU30479.1 hypothetical protein ETAA8_56190 [Anatilimnocola aggregata]